jgi:hypothetical protein
MVFAANEVTDRFSIDNFGNSLKRTGDLGRVSAALGLGLLQLRGFPVAGLGEFLVAVWRARRFTGV